MGNRVARKEVEPKTPLAKRLREVRRLLGDEDRERFAERVGVPLNSLAHYERGDRTPDADVLAAYRQRLGVSVDWLISEMGEPFLQERDEDESYLYDNSDGMIDPDVMIDITDCIDAVHAEAGAKLPRRATMSLAIEAYNAMVVDGLDLSDGKEIDARIYLLRKKLMRSLKAAEKEPGTGKRSA